MNSEEVYLELRNIGCCNRCCLRLLGEKFGNFEDAEQSLKELFSNGLEDETKTKKARLNPCTVCLGLLEDNFLNDILSHSCWKELQEFGTSNYRINFNMPTNMTIRDKAVNLYIKKKFPDYYNAHALDETVLLIHAVFKLAFKTRLDQNSGKKYDVHSDVQLWITLDHDSNEEEVEVIHKLDPITYKKRKYMKSKIFGKKAVNTTLSTVNEEKFFKHVKVPPEIPSTSVRINAVMIEGLTIFIGGRYCKYSRLLSQTPWNTENMDVDEINDEHESKDKKNRIITSCIQDIIFDELQAFGFDKEKMTFSSSGREDTDVRCLGSGRPFYIKIENVKKKLSIELIRKLEETINLSPHISVFDMQQVDKTSLKEVKYGEELKKKTYNVLCLIRDQVKCAEEIVKKINSIDCNQLIIQQQTPIRVAHRRTMSTRPKQIFYMKATEVPGQRHLFQLTVLTQAGTYVKEFIHGDFGRTSPCLGNLVDADVDIFRLDVIDIDLDWPQRINSVPHSAMQEEKLRQIISSAVIETENFDSSNSEMDRRSDNTDIKCIKEPV